MLDSNRTDQNITAATNIVTFTFSYEATNLQLDLHNLIVVFCVCCWCYFCFICRNVLPHKSGRNWRRPDITSMETSWENTSWREWTGCCSTGSIGEWYTRSPHEALWQKNCSICFKSAASNFFWARFEKYNWFIPINRLYICMYIYACVAPEQMSCQ